MADEKSKQLNETLSQIEKQFGKGTVMRMGDREVADIPAISTGSIGLDIALGIGGVPQGRVIEIFGPESSGKTTLTLQVIAECQKAGGTAAFIDAEHALDPLYAKKLGVKIKLVKNKCVIYGVGINGYKYKNNILLDVGNSGTLGRLIIGLLVHSKNKIKIIGDKSLSKRDFERVILPLQKIGANFKVNDRKNLPLKQLKG